MIEQRIDDISRVIESIIQLYEIEKKVDSKGIGILRGLQAGYEQTFKRIHLPIEKETVIRINEKVQDKGSSNYIHMGYRISNVQNFKTQNRKLSILTPPMPVEIPGMMDNLIDRLNDDTLNPEQRAAMALGGIFHIQPFDDGNKRTGKILMDKILLENNLSLSGFGSSNAFKNALVESEDRITSYKKIFQIKTYAPIVKAIR
jgi:Fic family protein